MRYFSSILFFIVFIFISCKKEKYDYSGIANNFEKIELVSNELVYDSVPHAAFTDLILHNKVFYLTFRSANDHGDSGGGTIKILSSHNLKNWNYVSTVQLNNYDLRDPKLFLDKDNNIVVSCHALWYSSTGYLMGKKQLYYTLNEDKSRVNLGYNLNISFWPWRTTLINDKYYSIGYSKRNNVLKLFESSNYFSYSTKCNLDSLSSIYNESTIRLHQDKLYALTRGHDDAAFAVVNLASKACDIQWNNIPIKNFGGPNFLVYKGKFIIGGRENVGKSSSSVFDRTSLFLYDPITQKLERLIILPSGGDTGYPGMVLEKNKLYISYYTTNEGKSKIYLATLNLKF